MRVHQKRRITLIFSSVLLAVLCLLLLLRRRTPPLTPWLVPPQGCQVVLSQPIAAPWGSTLYEGPTYYVRMWCPHQPQAALSQITPGLTRSGFTALNAARKMKPGDQAYRNSVLQRLRLNVRFPLPSNGGTLTIFLSGHRKVFIFVWPNAQGCVL